MTPGFRDLLRETTLDDPEYLKELLEASSDRLRHRLVIEEAIADASRLLIHSGGSDLGGVLKRLGQVVDADRAYIFRYTEKTNSLDNTHEWCGPGIEPQREQLQGLDASAFPWWMEQLRAGEYLSIPDVSLLPPTAVAERAILEAQEILSLLVVPISFSDGSLVGFMGFDLVRSAREWLPEDGRALRVVGEMIAGQWEQAQAREHYRKLIEQLNRVSTPREAAQVILLVADELLSWDAAWLALNDKEFTRIEPVLMFDQIDGKRTEMSFSRSKIREGGMTWRAQREGAFRIDRLPADPLEAASAPPSFGDHSRRSASILCVPICDGPQHLGVVSIQSYRPNAYSDADLQSLQVLAEHCAGSLKRCAAEADRLRLTVEHLKAEVARSESEEALRFAMTAARLGVWDRDMRTDVTTWTDYGQLLPTGEHPRVTLHTSQFLDLVHPADQPRLEEASRQAIEEDLEFALEFRMTMPDLGERWCSSRGRVLRDTSGQPFRFIGIGEDITERKRLELALREQEQFLNTVLENLTEGVLALDCEGTLTYCNEAVRQWFGIGRLPLPYTEWVNCLQILRSDGATRMQLAELPFTRALSGQALHDVEVVLQLPAQEKRTLLISAHPLVSAGGERPGVVATLRDITTSRELEEQFRQSQKMEAIGQLAGGVAHDFNNLLAVVIGYTELLLMGPHATPTQSAYLEEIRRAGDRAKNLTRQLLAYSRKQVIAPRPLDLGAAVSNMEQMLRRLIGEDIELTTRLDEGLTVVVDQGQLEQILLNLVVNARDAMPQGGKLTIEACRVTVDPHGWDLQSKVGLAQYVRLSVRDTGQGIDRATQRRLFEPFFTTKAPGLGTGLGLSTVYGIVKQWEGQIIVRSEPGHGATFEVYVPFIANTPGKVPQGTCTNLPQGRETILLVEDEDQVRRLTRQTLEMAGYTVLEASSPAEALRMSESSTLDVHLVLTDIVMPQMSGRELAQRLRACWPHVRIVYMSGYTDDAVVRHGVLVAETEFIQKPFSPAELTRRLRAVLDRSE